MAADLVFGALADPVRREILTILAEHDECSAGEVAKRVRSVGRSAVSTHLKVLKLAGLVVERKEGRFRYYSLDSAGPVREVLGFLHDLFQTSLDDLKSSAEARTRARKADTHGHHESDESRRVS
ncbi:Regulatory protein ArsR [Carbonactinospora thermoautotrophica]|uniref:Regulatory protein ArsR n=1 Tax=Carbonactinospora thermoautotrophica TaxID=1469144 RepID=A0A132MV59_9ACTN|nr:metalloregulator ArsR/SmtB family transcription factor [Carbonactinospora thermoautotrophica]KWX01262.1 Regulatory protein ArsR [Carbonactinospora thermoautotrophica]